MIRSPRHTLTRILLLTAAAVLLLAGCRKELCYNHWEHGYNVRAQVIPEWELEWRRDYGFGGSLFDWFQSSLPAFTLSPLDEEDGSAGEADDDDGWSLFDGLMPQHPPQHRLDRRSAAPSGRHARHPVLQQRHRVHPLRRPGLLRRGHRNHPYTHPRQLQLRLQERDHRQLPRHALRRLGRGIRGSARARGRQPGDMAACPWPTAWRYGCVPWCTPTL